MICAARNFRSRGPDANGNMSGTKERVRPEFGGRMTRGGECNKSQSACKVPNERQKRHNVTSSVQWGRSGGAPGGLFLHLFF